MTFTHSICTGEVMVIVEYCRFGNLQNFLVKHRQYFIDQIVRDKDIIDPSIQTRDPRWSNDSGFSYLNRYWFSFFYISTAKHASLEPAVHVNFAYHVSTLTI